MTGLYGTTAAPWRVLDETMGRKLVVFDGDKFDVFGDGTPVLSVGLPEQTANARAIAQIPAMLALVDAVADWVNIEDVRDMARAIVRELEKK